MIKPHQLTFLHDIKPFQPLTRTSLRIMSTKNFGDDEQMKHDPPAHEQRFDQEKAVKRNPHPDFRKVEASRPNWSEQNEWHFTKTRKPDWKLGDGANDGGESLKKNHVEIDPYEDGRPAVFNYKLLISGVIPRPIGFVSTRSADGTSPPNPRTSQHAHSTDTPPSHRPIHQPRPLLLHLPHKPRSPTPNHRIRRRYLQRQRHPHQPPLHPRMHHQHNLRALHRSRQRLFHQRSLRHLRMVTLRANPHSILSCQTLASERSSFFHRGKGVESSGIRESGDEGEEDGGAGCGGGGEILGKGRCDQ